MRGALAVSGIVAALGMAAPAHAARDVACEHADLTGVGTSYRCSVDVPGGQRFRQVHPVGCDRLRDFAATALAPRTTVDARVRPSPSFLLHDTSTNPVTGRIDRMRVRVRTSRTEPRVTGVNRSAFAVRVVYLARCGA